MIRVHFILNDDEYIREDRANNSMTHDIGYIQGYCFFR